MMKGIILFTLMWVSPLPFWVKYLFTTLWVIQIVCESTPDNKDK